MTRTTAIAGYVVVCGAVLVCAVSLARAQLGATPPADPTAGVPQDTPAPAAPLPGRGGRGGGGGGGRGNPGAPLYTMNCSGCHGTDLAGGRAPSLFDEKWLTSITDEEIIAKVRTGVPGTEMPSFKTILDDDQIGQLIKYIRTQSGTFKPRPTFVADPSGVVLKTEKQTVKMEVVTTGLNTPWGLAFLPDGRILVTERTENGGSLRIIDKGVLSPPVKGTPKVHIQANQQDAGMFDVIIHPKYAENGWIYLAYAEDQPGFTLPPPPAADAGAGAAGGAAGGGGRGRGRGGPVVPNMTAVVRGRLSKDNEWIDQQFIFHAPTTMYTVSGIHYGCRFTWDKEGHLFYSLGERGVMENAQNLSTPLGKIHRVNDDGSVPKDNPFVNTPNADPTIWTYGNRNPQGFGWDPLSGRLWESEHGPIAGDEINILKPGHNYGWGVVTKGTQPGITKTSEPGMDDPIVYYTPTFAPSGMTFYSGDKYPGWKNNLFVGGLAGQALRRLEIDGEKVTSQEVIFNQFGRVRDVVQGPDGLLYLVLQNATGAGTGYGLTAPSPGLVARMVPVQ